MLQNIRENAQGTIAKIIIGLIVISFAFFGVESLIGGGSQSVASVNGEDISPAQLENAILQERNRRMSRMGERLDPALIEPDVLRAAAIEQLIQQKLLLQLADESGIDISSASIDQTIVSMQQFQENGKFSQQLFQNILRSNGYTPAYFKQMMHSDLVIGQLSNGVTASEFVTGSELSQIAQVVGQKRSFRFLLLPEDFRSDDIVVAESDIEAYYQANPDEFKTEDRVKLEYIDVQQQQFFKPVSEDALQREYQAELDAFEGGEERRVSHILVAVGDGVDSESALQKAQSLRQQLMAGASFDELATAESDDSGSAGNGGDLGYTSGDTFPPSFEEALFALNLNEISEPVLTDAGYHLLKATDIKVTEKPDFEEMKPVLEQRIRLAESESDFVAAVEELKDLVFNSEGLKGPARDLGLTTTQSGWVTRSGAEGVVGDSRVIKAAFSDEVLNEGHNSAVIELAADHYIVVNVLQHEEPHVRALAQVQDAIRAKLEKQKKQEQIRALAASVVERLRSGASASTLAAELDREWVEKQSLPRSSTEVSREVLQSVFLLPLPRSESSPVIESVPLSTGGVAIIVLEDVTDGSLEDFKENDVLALKLEMQRALRSVSTRGFLTTLRDTADIEVF